MFVDCSATCIGCSYIHFINPSPTAAIIATFRNSVLFVERNIDPGRGKLDVPGGFYDMTDLSMEACAMREFREEIGISLPIERFSYLGSTRELYPWLDTKVDVLGFYYTCELSSTEVKSIRLDHENASFTFADKGTLDTIDLAWESDKRMLQKYWSQNEL